MILIDTDILCKYGLTHVKQLIEYQMSTSKEYAATGFMTLKCIFDSLISIFFAHIVFKHPVQH